MVRIAVCDDEIKIIKQVKGYLQEYQRVHNHEFRISIYDSGEKLVNSTAHFDLIFMDVEMPVINGIETAQAIRKKGRSVNFIYITHHSKYSSNVFAVHPFDFIEKPVTKEKIFIVLDDFFDIEYKKQSPEKIIFRLKETRTNTVFDVESIIMLEYLENKTIVLYTLDGEYKIIGNIDPIFQKLKKNKAFVSPHNSFIINMNYVKDSKNCIINMRNSMRVSIAQRRQGEFTKLLSEYIHSTIEGDGFF